MSVKGYMVTTVTVTNRAQYNMVSEKALFLFYLC